MPIGYRLGAFVAIWSVPLGVFGMSVQDTPRFTASGLSFFDGQPGFSFEERGEVIISIDETVDFAAPALALVPELSVFRPVLELDVDAAFGIYADFSAKAGVFSGAVDYIAEFTVPDAATLAPFQPVDLAPFFAQTSVAFEATTGSLDAALGLTNEIKIDARGSVSDPAFGITLGFDETLVDIARLQLVVEDGGSGTINAPIIGDITGEVPSVTIQRGPAETELLAIRNQTVEFLSGPREAIEAALGGAELPPLAVSFADLEADFGIVVGVPPGVSVEGQFQNGPGFALSTSGVGLGIDVGDVELSSPLLTVTAPATPSGAGVVRSGRTDLIGLNIDADSLLATTTLPTIGGASLEVGPLSADFDIYDLDIGLQSEMVASYSFFPELGVRLDFSQPVLIDRSFSLFPPIPGLPFQNDSAGASPFFLPPPTIPNPFPQPGPREITSLVLNQFDDFPLLGFLPGETIVTPTYFLEGGFYSDIFIDIFPEIELSFLSASLKFFGNGPTVGPAFEEIFSLDDMGVSLELMSLMAALDGFGTIPGNPFTVATCANFTLNGENDATCATPIALPGGGEGGTVAPIPLPPSVWMLGAAMTGLGIVGARRRRRCSPWIAA